VSAPAIPQADTALDELRQLHPPCETTTHGVQCCAPAEWVIHIGPDCTCTPDVHQFHCGEHAEFWRTYRGPIVCGRCGNEIRTLEFEHL